MKTGRMAHRNSTSPWRVRLLAVLLLGFSLSPHTLQAEEDNFDDLFSASFVDEHTGWVCGRWGCILHTTDGGKIWLPQDSGTDYTLSSICFVDRNNGWAVGNGGCIVRTDDGGKTWVKQKCPVPFFLMAVHFENAETGWIATERTHILHTDDGGESWEVQFRDEDFILKSISFCDARNGWAAGEYGYIYHTGDGGKTWVRQAGEFDFSDETGEIVGGSFLFDVIAVAPETAWVAGIDGYVARTVDGGKTWERMGQGLPRTHFFAVFSDRPHHVHIGGNASLFRSPDGGKTFRSLPARPAIKYSWMYDIAPRGGSGFVAVGSGGSIYLTENNSELWRKLR